MKKLIIGLIISGGLIVTWYLASPLFINKVVDEALPFAEITEEEFDEMVESLSEIDMELPTIDELREATPEQIQEFEEKVLEESKDMPTVVVEDDMPTGPTVLATGEFMDADSFHMGSGDAKIINQPDGTRILRFENFDVTNGPDLRVLLASGSSPTNSGNLGEYVELGKLKGNMGNQNYVIPSTVDIDSFNSVVIYCKPFHVVFSTATLK